MAARKSTLPTLPEIVQENRGAKRLCPHEVVTRFLKCVAKNGDSGCWEWGGRKNQFGYGEFFYGMAHRFSYEWYVGEIPEWAMVLHDCDNRGCVNPAHLRLGTHGDNMLDRNQKDRQARGERHGRAKLCPDDVRAIRKLLSDGVPPDHVAERFGVTGTNIRMIKKGKRWAHLK